MIIVLESFGLVIFLMILIYIGHNNIHSPFLRGIKKWLLLIVTQAEIEFGTGTGRLKIIYAYDCFIKSYPIISKIVSFRVFSAMIDVALNELKHLLETNGYIQDLVGHGNEK